VQKKVRISDEKILVQKKVRISDEKSGKGRIKIGWVFCVNGGGYMSRKNTYLNPARIHE
jgi:hypothetical protein